MTPNPPPPMSADACFSRTLALLGPAAMERLRRATVLVAGLGAVGSYAVEALARAGIGRLRLVDFDVVQPSNLNRQLFALTSTLGRPKVEVAAERVRDIHPQCTVETSRLFIAADTVGTLFREPPDALVDAIDSLGPKVALLATAHRVGVWTVSAMGAATRTDPLAIRVADISATERCPLARWVRRRLRALGIERGIRCVYSLEPAPRRALAAADPPPPEFAFRRGRPRRALGSLPTLTGMFGLIAANEVILHLADARSATDRSRDGAAG
ncbi:MAG: tRNA threonylcarbamoyladenosine dehydratase [Kiritimatiellae bacterium]|nr:tRNA threonylcarbamoyladenosine dehydratase [Kiritimatiellia bacterium]